MTSLSLATSLHLALFGQRCPAARRPRSVAARAPPPQSHRFRRQPQLSLQPPRAGRTAGSHAGRRAAAGVLARRQKHAQEDRATAIRERLLGAEALPPSAYDTAWVAMVPAPAGSGSPPAPRYPGCVDWILRNQRRDDGSWGPGDPSLRKDALSSTLACVLALRKWGAGGDTVERGTLPTSHSAAGRRLCIMPSSLHAPLLQGSVSSGATGPA